MKENEMIHTSRVLIVEGKYDAARLSHLTDAMILLTDGFGIYSDKKRQQLFKALAQKNGLILLTDSDAAGFRIRTYITNLVGEKNVVQAYVPAIHGKEKRKEQPGKEGLLGVEGVDDAIVLQALRDALGAEAGAAPTRPKGRQITYTDLYEWGLSGRPGSAERKAKLLNALGLHFATDGYTPVHRGRARDFLAWGYFQSARYFDDFADEIKAELRPKAAPAGELAAAIAAAAYPAAVHLRRGDYCRPENEILQVCTPAYYARAAAAVKAAHPDATLFVFSDDVDWAKQNLNTADLPAVFAPRGSAVGDMALMEQCRGFVLSNSTYSWWAQYLAKTSDKLVLAPEKWYAHTKKSALYLPDWQLIETD